MILKGLDRYREHNVEVVIEQWTAKPLKTDLEKSVVKALDLSRKMPRALGRRKRDLAFHFERRSRNWQNLPGDRALSSFLEFAQRMVPFCRGYGKILTSTKTIYRLTAFGGSLRTEIPAPNAKVNRLNEISRNIVLYGPQGTRLSLPEVLALNPSGILSFLKGLKVEKNKNQSSMQSFPGILERLGFMEKVGLDYLSMDRETSSLSGGEAQRIRLASQLGSNLSGVLYVLDEPSIGLHPVDNQKLIGSLRDLQARGNSLVVVEHDLETIMQADHLIDIGPQAGRAGGK